MDIALESDYPWQLMCVNRVALLAVLAIVGCQQEPPQPRAESFDLACIVELYQSGAAERKAIKSFRVDLAAGLWCEDGCASIERIASIEPDTLRLVDRAEDETDGRIIIIDRLSGRVIGAQQVGAFRQAYNGMCDREPFSKFPETIF